MKEYYLKDLLKIKNGKDHKSVSDGDIPIYGSGGIMRYGNQSLYEKESILLPRKGTLNNIQFSDKPFWTVDTLYYTETNSTLVEPYFLYNYLKILNLEKLNTGTGVPSMTFDSYYNLKILLPDLETQKKIADIIKNIDNKIAVNNSINDNLEKQAKAIYDYWFVQNADENWEVKTIDKYAEVTKGNLITAKEAKAGSIKVVAAGVDFSYFHSDFNREKNTITISGSGANAGFVNFWREPIFASDCITVRGKSDLETILLLHYLKSVQGHILKQAKGSAQPHVYPSDIKVLNYAVPPQSLLEKFEKIFIPMNNQIANNLQQNQQLADLRDFLLPMLMNGQITVR